MYAIVNISGKQFKAEKGSTLCVPKQLLGEGKKLVLEDVRMVHDGKTAKFGNPKVSGAKVTATVIEHVINTFLLKFRGIFNFLKLCYGICNITKKVSFIKKKLR